MDIRSIAHLGRFREIITTLAKYGFHDIVERLEIPGLKYLKKVKPKHEDLHTWERVRKILEELGPTFIKLGQILSQRADIVPEGLMKELSKLQDDVHAEDFEDIKKVLEKNYAAPLDDIFSEIDPLPLAAASMAQVHRARLRENGREVALKVQRPGIEETIKNDLEILEKIAVQLDGRMEYFKVYNLPQLVRRIKKLIFSELNFTYELRNMQVAAAQMKNEQRLRVPDTFPELSTSQVLVMELCKGTQMKNVDIAGLTGREELAKSALHFTLRQVLGQGFFHADPHPGNILVDDEENLIILDWGMVGRLTPKVRHDLIDLIAAIVENDVDEVTELLLNFTSGTENINMDALQGEVLEIVSHFTRMPLKEINLGRLLMELTTALREHGRVLTSDLSIMIKSLITAEQTAKMLYPDLDVVGEAEPILRSIGKERFKPDNLLKGLYKNFRYLLRFQYQLPRQAMDIISKLDQGQLAIRFRHENLEGMQTTMETVVNRLVAGIIAAALFLGASMIFVADTGPMLWGHPLLGTLGYAVATVLCLNLVVTMLRSRRRRFRK
ncbi:ABC-1 domain protein [Desulfonatronospira thiodismutans ASO3-1]|uniref:ABC-1 domain protein n=2 Tax=Desulfonatronospira TaxID=488937 RepID=D6STN8_9BACT|nr:AarF/UbiB family protein [Desulfonatronospira thiodismutans]EFI34054.1 ABC-1 domain protein [Desulfonatronospira thiodismutans ASO3-1]